ncbi:MAG: hypothetical protein Q4615_14590 [Paracoccus aminovorans]|nr:hypothetical protein [Paracoccus aminovorans]
MRRCSCKIWPEAKLLIYTELLYRPRDHDVGFDTEMSPDSEGRRASTVTRSGI